MGAWFGRDGAGRQPVVTESPSSPLRRLLRPAGRLVEPKVAVVLLILLGLVGYPILLLVLQSLNAGDPQVLPPQRIGLVNFATVLGHLTWLRNSLLIACLGTILATSIGTALAWLLNRLRIPAAGWFELLIVVPYPMGPLVAALAWIDLGSPHSGLVNRLFQQLSGAHWPLIDTLTVPGVVIVMAIFQAPVAFLMVSAAMRSMDPALEEVSAVLGAGKFATAWRVTLPLMAPAVLGAALFLFISMIGAFAIPTMLGADSRFYPATTVIYTLFQGYPPNYPLAAALGMGIVALALLAMVLYSRLLRGRSYTVIGSRTYQPHKLDVGRGQVPILALLATYVGAVVVLPIAALILASLQKGDMIVLDPSRWSLHSYHYVLLDYPVTRTAILDTLLLGVATGTVGGALAAVATWVVDRSRTRSAKVIEYVVTVIQALPGLIFTVGLLWMVLSIHLYGSLWALLIAYVAVFLPLAYRSLAGVVVQISRSLEEAGKVCGGSGFRVARTISVPLMRPGLVAAWMLLFMVSIQEIGAAIFLTGPNFPVLGPSIFNFWDSGALANVSALAVVQGAIVAVALVALRRLGGARLF